MPLLCLAPLGHPFLAKPSVSVFLAALIVPKADFPTAQSGLDTVTGGALHLRTERKAGAGQLVLVKVCGLLFQPVEFFLFPVDRAGKLNLLRRDLSRIILPFFNS